MTNLFKNILVFKVAMYTGICKVYILHKQMEVFWE